MFCIHAKDIQVCWEINKDHSKPGNQECYFINALLTVFTLMYFLQKAYTLKCTACARKKGEGREWGKKYKYENTSNVCLAELFFNPPLYENCNLKQGISALRKAHLV